LSSTLGLVRRETDAQEKEGERQPDRQRQTGIHRHRERHTYIGKRDGETDNDREKEREIHTKNHRHYLTTNNYYSCIQNKN